MSKGIPKNQLKTRNTIIQSEHEDDADAKRVLIVDELGNFNSPENPLFVQLSDGSVNIGTVNAELEVQLSHIDNDPDAGDVADSVRIGDGVEIAEIKPDGSLQVGEGLFNSIQTLETDTSLASAFNTSAIDVGAYSRGMLKAVWSGANDSNDATFVIEVSDNATDWSQLGESGMVLLQEDDTQIWQILEFPARYMRLVYTENSNDAGTVDITFMGRY